MASFLHAKPFCVLQFYFNMRAVKIKQFTFTSTFNFVSMHEEEKKTERKDYRDGKTETKCEMKSVSQSEQMNTVFDCC